MPDPDVAATVPFHQVVELLELLDRALDYSQRPDGISYASKLQWHSQRASSVYAILEAGRTGTSGVPWMIDRLRELLDTRQVPAIAEGGDAHAERRMEQAQISQGTRVTGPVGATPPTPAGPPDLHQAVQAATEALSSYEAAFAWGHPESLARIAVEAAWGVLTQPLADLQRDLDYADLADWWDTKRAAELDHLATFEVAVRNALKPLWWSGIDADGKNYRDVVEQVGKAVAALDQARERTDG